MPPRKRKKAQPASRGLSAAEAAAGTPPAAVAALRAGIEEDGGAPLSVYRDPLGGHWQILAALPIDRVEPTPFQRDLSAAHVKRLTAVLEALDRFLDPIIAVRSEDGRYWTPNGNHRLASLKALGARSVIALVIPETEVAYKILALNTEKAHNLREKSLEVIRMARDLAGRDGLKETDYALEFEEAAFLTLGICYEQNGRFAGGAYHPILKRVDAFLGKPLAFSLELRADRAAEPPRARRGGGRGDEEPQGTGLREPVPARFRRGPDQPHPIPEKREGRVRRDHPEDDGLRPEVQGREREARAGRARGRRGGGVGMRRFAAPRSGLLVAFVAAACRRPPRTPDLATAKVVDLTHAFDQRTLYWPTSPSAFELKPLAAGQTPGGWYYSSNAFCTPEHGGTHLDAPDPLREGRTHGRPHSGA